MIGETISHYRIVSTLGGGGMGIVYEAEDTKFTATGAQISSRAGCRRPASLERFQREARAIATPLSPLSPPHLRKPAILV
jgi:eukaryotic-like serine/threonine-protein kinase